MMGTHPGLPLGTGMSLFQQWQKAGGAISIQLCSLLPFPVYPVFIKCHLGSTTIIGQICFVEKDLAYRNM